MLNSWDDFSVWEKSAKDTIDVKRCYIDLAGDLIAGVLLSQLIYWFLLSDGKSKLRIAKEGREWVAKKREDWWEECRITPRQYDRAIEVLKKKRLVVVKIFKFNGSPTIHISLEKDNILYGLNSLMKSPFLTKGENGNSPKGKIHFPQTVNSLITEITTETTTNISLRETLLQRLRRYFPHATLPANVSTQKIDYFLYLIEQNKITPAKVEDPVRYIQSSKLVAPCPFPSFLEREERRKQQEKARQEELAKEREDLERLRKENEKKLLPLIKEFRVQFEKQKKT